MDSENQVDTLLGNIKELREGEPLLPRLLGMLVKERQSVKKQLKGLSGEDSERRSQLDNKQNALKLIANSIYGCLGFK